MTLFEALRVLATTHTRDDDQLGFVLVAGLPHWPFSEFSHEDYTEAWRIVRHELHMPTEPIGSAPSSASQPLIRKEHLP